MNKFTTSAQKTLTISKEEILRKLKEEMTKNSELIFTKTNSQNIRKAKLRDGSTIVIAGFEKENGKTLAMIDHKNLSVSFERDKVQAKLKDKLEKIFKSRTQ